MAGGRRGGGRRSPSCPCCPQKAGAFWALTHRYTTCPPPFTVKGFAGMSVQLVQLVIVEGLEEPFTLKGMVGYKLFLCRW